MATDIQFNYLFLLYIYQAYKMNDSDHIFKLNIRLKWYEQHNLFQTHFWNDQFSNKKNNPIRLNYKFVPCSNKQFETKLI